MAAALRYLGAVVVVLLTCTATSAAEQAYQAKDITINADEQAAYEKLTKAGVKCQLTKDGRILRVSLETPIAEDLLKCLDGCKSVAYISSRGDLRDGPALASLPRLPSVESLSISGILTDDMDLTWLDRVPNVSSINLNWQSDVPANRSATQLPVQAPTVERLAATLSKLEKLELLRLNGLPINVAAAGHLANIKKLARLELNDSWLGDDGVKRLSTLANLQYLYVDNTRISDAGVAHLLELKKLLGLSLNGTPITDKALETIGQSEHRTSLAYLYLSDTSVTDSGLAGLGSATGLQVLSLSHTSVTGAGLTHLEKLSKLYNLTLDGAPVTEQQLADLRKKIPVLQSVSYDRPHAKGQSPKQTADSTVARPLVRARLKDGAIVEGLLEQLVDGKYTLRQESGTRTFAEADVRDLIYVPSAPPPYAEFREKLRAWSDSHYQDIEIQFELMGRDRVACLREMLSDLDPNIRELTASAIYQWIKARNARASRSTPSREITQLLLDTLRDPNPKVRVTVVKTFGLRTDFSALVYVRLSDLLNQEPDETVAGAIIETLCQFVRNQPAGHPSVQALVDLLVHNLQKNPKTYIQALAASGLGSLGSLASSAADALDKARDADSLGVEEQATRAFDAVGGNFRREQRAIGTDDKVIDDLLIISASYDSASAAARNWAAAEAVKRLSAAGPKNLEAALMTIRLDKSHRCRPDITTAITNWGPDVVPDLEKHAEDPDYDVRLAIAYSLTHMLLQTIPKIFSTLMHDSNDAIRSTASSALAWQLGAGDRQGKTVLPAEKVDAGLPLLFEAIQTPRRNWQTTSELFRAIENIGLRDPRVLPALIKVAKSDDQKACRPDVINAIGRLVHQQRDPDIAASLAFLSDVAKANSEKKARTMAIYWIGNLKQQAKSELAMLEKLSGVADREIAEEAAQACEKITGQRPANAPRKPATVADPLEIDPQPERKPEPKPAPYPPIKPAASDPFGSGTPVEPPTPAPFADPFGPIPTAPKPAPPAPAADPFGGPPEPPLPPPGKFVKPFEKK